MHTNKKERRDGVASPCGHFTPDSVTAAAAAVGPEEKSALTVKTQN